MTETDNTPREQVLKIALAALLHDIGKFAQRARGDEKNAGEVAFYPSREFMDKQRGRLQPFSQEHGYTHEHAVYTAAFIDHLEKILPACFQKANWGGSAWVGDLAAGHHFVKRSDDANYVQEWHSLERWVIALADRMASALDRKGFAEFDKGYNRNKEIANYKSARLWPIVEAIKFSESPGKRLEDGFKYRIPLQELRADRFFPGLKEKVLPSDNKAGAEEYQKLFADFVSELMGLEQFKDNVELWFEQFDNLYMRYGGQIPAATVSPAMQDISLYDHSKITAAIAVSLYIYHFESGLDKVEQAEDPQLSKLLFVGAAFNGIQKFIFASGGSTNKAAAKILRGRSFYVSLLSEMVGDMILQETGLPPTSIVFSAAGQVTLIAPNLPRIKEAVDRVRKIANEWLLETYYGQTSVSFSTVEVSPENIARDYRQMWHRLSRAMEQEKFSKFDLAAYGGTQVKFFEQFKPELGVCSYCGQRPARSVDDTAGMKSICGICKDQIDIGSKLVKADSIAVWAEGDSVFGKTLNIPLFGRYQLWLGRMGEAVKYAQKGKLLKIARLSPAKEEPDWRKLAFKPIKGYVPVYSEEDEYLGAGDEEVRAGDIKSFETLAKAASKELIPGEGKTGVAALGVLKADVDNLGMIFGLGLDKEVQTLTRVSVLSRQFNNFFAVYLPTLLQEKFSNVYTVFAGGDDLFLIGPWCDMLDLAPVIRGKFAEFVCGNPEITLSMGISIHKPGEPVAVMAKAAEEALEKAKSAAGKDSVCIFGEVVKWNELSDLSGIAVQIRSWLSGKTLNTAMLYRFNEAINSLEIEKALNMRLKSGKKVAFEKLASSMAWKARLKYSLVRNIGWDDQSIKAGETEMLRAELEQTISWLDKYGTGMKIPLWQEIYRRRKN